MNTPDAKSEPEGAGHTAGPWITQGWVPTWAYIPVKDAQHNLVASLYPDISHGYSRESVEANARLIAAAPDLLAMLQWALKNLDGIADGDDLPSIVIRDKARALIAKATGAAP